LGSGSLQVGVRLGCLLDQPAIIRDRYVTSGPPATVPPTISITAPGAVATPPGQSILTVSVTAGGQATGWAQQTVTGN
jgi:hypothetical protein